MIVRAAPIGVAGRFLCQSPYEALTSNGKTLKTGGDLAPEFVPFWDLSEWQGNSLRAATITGYTPPMAKTPLSAYFVHRATFDTIYGPPASINDYRAGLVWSATTGGTIDFTSEISTYTEWHGIIDGQLYVLDQFGKRVQVSKSNLILPLPQTFLQVDADTIPGEPFYKSQHVTYKLAGEFLRENVRETGYGYMERQWSGRIPGGQFSIVIEYTGNHWILHWNNYTIYSLKLNDNDPANPVGNYSNDNYGWYFENVTVTKL